MVTPDNANREIEQAEHATQFDRLSPTAKVRVNRLCDRFELLWQKESFADLDEFAAELTPEERESTIQELVEIDLVFRHRLGFLIEVTSYLTRFESLNEKWLADRIQSITTADREKNADSIQLVPQQRLGDYTILGPLGAGGMGLVYRAEHRLMGRQVAIKILKASHTSDAASKLRFEREVRTLSKLSHPHIVVAYDAREQDGKLFLVTELIDGEDLASLIKRKGPLKPRDAMYYTWQAAKGLHYAHEQGIIHRDVKPSNLILERKKTVKVLDLGLARLRDAEQHRNSPSSGITSADHIVGTAAFMSPEQATTPNEVTEKSDIYSLGCTLYYLLTGKAPYQAQSDLEIILAHLNAPIPALNGMDQPDLTPALRDLLRRMLDKRPERRPASMNDVISQLATFIKAESIATAVHLKPRIEKRYRRTRRKSTKLWLVMTSAVIAGIPIAVIAWPFLSQSVRETRPNENLAANSKNVPTQNNELPDARVKKVSWNSGLRFDGTKSFVRVPFRDVEIDSSFAIEVATVANPQSTPANLVTVSGHRCMVLFLANRCWGVAYYDGVQSQLIVSDANVVYRVPTIVAGSWRNSRLALWINGEMIPSHEIDYPMQPGPMELFIGGIPTGVIPEEQGMRFFDGKISAVRIQSGRLQLAARTLDELVRVDAATVAMFDFTEGKGFICQDRGPRQRTGSIIAAQWFSGQSQ